MACRKLRATLPLFTRPLFSSNVPKRSQTGSPPRHARPHDFRSNRAWPCHSPFTRSQTLSAGLLVVIFVSRICLLWMTVFSINCWKFTRWQMSKIPPSLISQVKIMSFVVSLVLVSLKFESVPGCHRPPRRYQHLMPVPEWFSTGCWAYHYSANHITSCGNRFSVSNWYDKQYPVEEAWGDVKHHTLIVNRIGFLFPCGCFLFLHFFAIE